MTRRLRGVSLALLAGVCLFSGCREDVTSERIIVEVSLLGLGSELTLLQVDATLNGHIGIPARQSVPGNQSSLRISLPAQTTGDLGLLVDGFKEAGCVVTRGRGDTHLDGPGSYQVAIELHGQPIGCLVPAGTSYALAAVWGSGPGDVWVVGAGGTTLHWNGASWAAVPSGAMGDLHSVWGSGPNDVWAVGREILHWNSTAWSSFPSTNTDALGGVWGSGPDDAWAVGGGGLDSGDILHWNGAAWSVVAITSTFLSGVWGSGPSDVWAVGFGSQHWNALPGGYLYNTGPSANSIWGSGPSDVWAVGNNILHWNGTAWTATAVDTAPLSGVWGSGPNDVWAVGNNGILHWNGTTWAQGD